MDDLSYYNCFAVLNIIDIGKVKEWEKGFGKIIPGETITVGAKDIFTPLEFSELIHQNIPHSEFIVFPEGGHAHHWEDLERFNKETLAFLLRH